MDGWSWTFRITQELFCVYIENKVGIIRVEVETPTVMQQPNEHKHDCKYAEQVCQNCHSCGSPLIFVLKGIHSIHCEVPQLMGQIL